MMKSTSDRYGAVAVTLHWLSAFGILALLATGFRAADAPDPAALLRLHVPLGIAVLALTVFRVVWWLALDRKPAPIANTLAGQERLARGVHLAFYIVLFGMFGSGIALMAMSGAGAVLFGGGPLPDFSAYGPRAPHGIGAMLLIALLIAHVAAALYHALIRRDAIFRRMWYGKGKRAD
ncbi:cytochrome b [Pseudogemmobacter sonorensis]|uniref:cytochrome b n=1 Tax=Pseudogemmobacter sonorensis TaxID=2989681 RepID=UPI0036BDD582